MKKKFLSGFIAVLLIGFFVAFFSPSIAHASVLDDFLNGVKNFLNIPQDIKKELKIDANIELAPDGDVNKNGQIDAGDTVRFSYTITNTTDQAYSFATLKTNINRKQLNFIHNVTGATNLNDDGKTITISNFRIAPGQVVSLSFDARVNYFTKEDPVITTEADFIGKDKKSHAKSKRKEIKAKRILKEKIPGMVKQKIGNE